MEKSEIDIDKNKILELENEIYPVCQGSKTCDEEVEKLYTIKNWAEMFYHAKTKIIKDRFLKLISLSFALISEFKVKPIFTDLPKFSESLDNPPP